MQEDLFDLVQLAGRTVMDIYVRGSFESVIEWKDDNSPLTIADKASNEVLVEGLKKIKDIPILSEESKMVEYDERRNWGSFWLVDPLDGTKEFIKRNGEFTINVALIEGQSPAMGVIVVPDKHQVYFGKMETGSKRFSEGTWEEIQVTGFSENKNLTAVGSRSHASEEDEQVMKKFGVSQKKAMGSALKFCLVAEGEADIYYRHNPTMEWDTGAGQAIVEAAGGSMFKGNDINRPFVYNKNSLLNGSFLCLGRRFNSV